MSTRNSGATTPLRRIVAASVTAVLALVTLAGLASPANAAGTEATVTKALLQPQDDYLVGQTVAYRLTSQCSSLTGPCEVGTLVDQLDPNLEFQNLVYPTAPGGGGTLPAITHTIVGNTLTITIGDAAKPYLDGQALEFVLYTKVKTYPAATDGIIPNQASISIPDGPTNNSSVVEVQVVEPVNDWKLTKTQLAPSSNPIPLDSDVRYVLRLTRPGVGNVAMGGIDIADGFIEDTIPEGSVFVPALTSPTGFTYNAATRTVRWPLPAISSTANMNCQSNVCSSTTFVPIVGVHYPSPPFVPGQTVVNNAAAYPNYVGGTTGQLDASAPTTFFDEDPTAPTSANSVKVGPTSAFPGQTIAWDFRMENTGTTHLANPAIVEELPAGIENVSMVRWFDNVQPGSDSLIPVLAQYSSDGGVTWSAPFQITATDNPVPAGTTHIRLSAIRLSYQSEIGMHLVATISADAAIGSSIVNCVSSSADGQVAWTNQRTCTTTTVVGKTASMSIRKGHIFSDVNAASVKPGETFHWVIAVKVEGGADVESVVVSDLLPPEFEYVETDCYTNSSSAYSVGVKCVEPNPSFAIPAAVVTQEAGGTRVTYPDVPLKPRLGQPTSAFWHYLHLEVRVKPGTSITSYTNTAYTTTNDADVMQCKNENVAGAGNGPDTADIDADGDTTDLACFATDPVNVAESAYIDLTKWDKGTEPNVLESSGQPDESCPDWDGFTRYPCVAQTLPGGSFEYRLRMLNQGNIALTDYVVYDILPVVGDTGVGETLGDGSRGTEWAPVLTGPVTLDGALSDADGSDYLVEYNLTSNPCRPELAEGETDADWQAGACDDSWVTSVDDWSTVKSFRITAFQDGALWTPGTAMVFVAPMTAPLAAPQSTQAPLDLSVAWNSVAQRVYRTTVGGAPLRLEAYEPRKVGIIVPFTIPPTVSVGDYVWYDENRDGQQDAAEVPASGVTVRLLNADGIPVAETQTSAEGYYWFTNLTPEAEYTIVFVPPAGFEWTVRDEGDDASDSDVDPATNSISITAPAYVEGVSQNLGAPRVADDPSFDGGLVVPLVAPEVYAVGDYVWIDTDDDGTQDAGESPVVGVTVTLLTADGEPAMDADGNVVAPVVTDDAGHYVFDNLPAGTYVIRFSDLPEGYLTAKQTAAGEQAEADDSNGPAGLAETATTPAFTLGASEPGMSPVADTDGAELATLINRTIDLGLVLEPTPSPSPSTPSSSPTPSKPPIQSDPTDSPEPPTPSPEPSTPGPVVPPVDDDPPLVVAPSPEPTPEPTPPLAATGASGVAVFGYASAMMLVGGLALIVRRRRQEGSSEATSLGTTHEVEPN